MCFGRKFTRKFFSTTHWWPWRIIGEVSTISENLIMILFSNVIMSDFFHLCFTVLFCIFFKKTEWDGVVSKPAYQYSINPYGKEIFFWEFFSNEMKISSLNSQKLLLLEVLLSIYVLSLFCSEVRFSFPETALSAHPWISSAQSVVFVCSWLSLFLLLNG